MTYPLSIYVLANGEFVLASQTDQAHTRLTSRTYRGKPAVYAGKWYASQFNYRPFHQAVAAAAKAAAAAEAAAKAQG